MTRRHKEHKAPGAQPRVFLGVVLLLMIAVGLGLRWHALNEPPGQADGLSGMIARNYLKYGFPDLGLAQIVSPGPVLPPAERVYYLTHPPLAPLLDTVGVALLGPTTAALRLPQTVIGLLAIGVLAWYARRLWGASAGGWCAAAALALPVAVTYGSAWPDPLGATMVLAIGLLFGAYWLYARSGRRRHVLLLVACSILAALTDWPAYLVPFALVAHAFVYRSNAKPKRMLVALVPPILAFAGLTLYARAVPVRQHVYGTLGHAFTGWSRGGVSGVGPVGWAWDFGRKFVALFSPLVLVAVPWLLWRVPRAVVRRDSAPVQHAVLLWLWPLPFLAVFPRIFYSHEHYHLVFLPAAVVTFGGFGRWVLGSNGASARRLRAVLCAAGCVFLALWGHYVVVARPEPLRDYRLRTCQWAADLAAGSEDKETNAFTEHYAMQMRFLADRRVVQEVDSLEQVLALASHEAGRARRLFVPQSYPVGGAGFGAELFSRFEARAFDSTVAFDLASAPGRPDADPRRLGPVPFAEGVSAQEIEWRLFEPAEGRRVLYLGVQGATLPAARAGDVLEWVLLFNDGPSSTEACVPARPTASYFVPCPAAWSPATGRVELVLRRVAMRAPRSSVAGRIGSLVLRVLSLSHLGLPKKNVTRFPTKDGSPLELPVGPRLEAGPRPSATEDRLAE